MSGTIVKSYIVSCGMYGITFYLSIMGGHSKGVYNYMWDIDAHNAREFPTRKEARRHAEIALSQLNSQKDYEILSKYTHRNGAFEIKSIKQYKITP